MNVSWIRAAWSLRGLIGLMLVALLAAGCAPIDIQPSPANTVPPSLTPIPTLVPMSPTSPPVVSTSQPPSPTPAPVTATPPPTAVPPSPTSVPPPPTAVPRSPTPVPPSSTPAPQVLQIFLIAVEDNGRAGKRIGCGDSVVPVQVVVPHTQGVLRAALEELLSLEEQYYGESGLYNALYQSNLQLERVVIEDGRAVIELSGALMLGGVCDNPRVQAQLEETALQFSTVNAVSIFVNGTPLQDLLSQQG